MNKTLAENRKYLRSLFVFPVRFGLISRDQIKPGEYFHAFSDNISEGGLKIEIKKEIPLKTRLSLRFDLIIHEKLNLVETEADIRWIRKKTNGFFEYGIGFDGLTRENWKIVSQFMNEYCKG